MRVLTDRTQLTAREIQVMELVCEGLSDHEIGDHLGVSMQTVKSHMRRVLHVLRARNRTHAAVLFVLGRE